MVCFYLLLFFCWPLSVAEAPDIPPDCLSTVDSLHMRKVYLMPTEFPDYPGGSGQLLKDLMQHLVVISDEESCGSTVVLKYIVEATGETSQWEVPDAICPALNQALLAATSGLPPYQPGTCYGRPVPVQMRLPIRVCFK